LKHLWSKFWIKFWSILCRIIPKHPKFWNMFLNLKLVPLNI